MKKLATVLSVLMVAVIMTTVAFAGDFIIETTTRGDWVGKYGSEGYYILGDTIETCLIKLPSYASIKVTDMFGEDLNTYFTWWDETSGEECLNDPLAALWVDEAKSSRRASCQYDATAIDINIDVGTETKLVSLYINDFDASTAGSIRVMDVTLLDKDGNELAFTTLEDSIGGVYLTAQITGSVTFDIVKVEGPNVVYSGIFFDPVASASSVETDVSIVNSESSGSDEVNVINAPVETSPVEANTVTTSPQTIDYALLIIIMAVIASGTAVSIKKRV